VWFCLKSVAFVKVGTVKTLFLFEEWECSTLEGKDKVSKNTTNLLVVC
jgi:hypothetical protein